MLRNYILLFLFLFSHLFAMALPIIINGKSAANDAFIFRLYTQKDAFSGLEYLADQQRPNKDGEFMLGFESNEIQKVNIKVGLQSISIYVIPGQTYELNFDEILIADQNVFLPQHPLHVVFEKEDLLNVVIDGFDYEYQRFLEKNFITLIKYRDKKIYYKFAENMLEKLEQTPLKDSLSIQFFNDYIYYHLAELRLIAKIQPKQELGFSEITNKPLLLNNPAYVGFLKKYFDKYLQDWNVDADYHQLKDLINEGIPIHQLMDKLGKDPVLIKEKLRELVLLYSLKQSFYNKDFNKEAINEIFVYLSNESKFSNNREISGNLKIVLNRFIKGQAVPSFQLLNAEGVTKSISSYLGKKVYLMFVAPGCETCEADIRILKALENELSEQLQLVTIYSGFDKEEARKWANSHDANWDFLWFDDDFTLLNDYQVKTFPKYLMLDEEGDLYHYFPPKPRENLLAFIKSSEKQDEAKEQNNNEGAKDLFRKN